MADSELQTSVSVPSQASRAPSPSIMTTTEVSRPSCHPEEPEAQRTVLGSNGDFERQPLLGPRANLQPPRPPQPLATRLTGNQRLQVLLLFVVVAAIDATIFILTLPLTRVYESIACYQWYATERPGQYPDPRSVPESKCKVGPVQEKLALVRGMELFFMAAPGALPISALLLPLSSMPKRLISLTKRTRK